MATINVITEYEEYTYKSSKKLLKLVLGKHYNDELFIKLFDVYKKVRYYNALEKKKSSFLDNVTYHLVSKSNRLITEYKDIKKIDKLLTTYINILFLDGLKEIEIKKFVKEISVYRKQHFNLESKNFENEFINLYVEIDNNKKSFIKQFETNKFKVHYYLTNHKKVYNANLEYNFKISSLFSETAISKVYNTGVISEDKLFVLYYLVASKILKQVLEGDFNYHYILEFSTSLFTKEAKYSRLMKLMDNELIKEKTSLKVYFKDYLDKKSVIMKNINKGYNYVLVLDKSYIHKKDEAKNLSLLFKYIIVDINEEYYNDFSEFPNIIKSK